MPKQYENALNQYSIMILSNKVETENSHECTNIIKCLELELMRLFVHSLVIILTSLLSTLSINQLFYFQSVKRNLCTEKKMSIYLEVVLSLIIIRCDINRFSRCDSLYMKFRQTMCLKNFSSEIAFVHLCVNLT